MKISTLLKAFSIFAVATQGSKYIKNSYQNGATYCNDFNKTSDETVLIGGYQGQYSIIPAQTCQNITLENCTQILPTEIQCDILVGNSQGEQGIGRSDFFDNDVIVMESDNDQLNPLACLYRNEKGIFEIEPPVEYSCPCPYPSP